MISQFGWMSFSSSASCFCFKIKRTNVQSTDSVWEHVMREHLWLAGRAGICTIKRNRSGSARVVHIRCCILPSPLHLEIQSARAAEMGHTQTAVQKGSQLDSFDFVFTCANRSKSKPKEENMTKVLKSHSKRSFPREAALKTNKESTPHQQWGNSEGWRYFFYGQ